MEKEKKFRIKDYVDRSALIFLLIGIIILASLGYGTLANKTIRGISDNEITSGEIKTKIINVQTDGTDMPDCIYSILPGTTIGNEVYAMNVCTHPQYVRIKVTPVIKDENNKNLSIEPITFKYNEKDWTYKDGFWYYNHILYPGQITSFLYNSIYFGTEIDNSYKFAALTVFLDEDAVQSVNNGDVATDAIGWDDN